MNLKGVVNFTIERYIMCVNEVDPRRFYFVLMVLVISFFAKNAFAQDQKEKALKESIIEAVESLGYEKVEVHQCELRFSFKLDNSCPSDRPIGFERVIKLQHIPDAGDFAVEPLRSTDARSNILRFDPVRPYFSSSGLRFREFQRFVRIEFPNSNWPRRYDDQMREIGLYFWDAFPDLDSFSRWKFDTCFGPSYSIDSQIGVTGASIEMLRDLGGAIKEYRSSEVCSKNNSL